MLAQLLAQQPALVLDALSATGDKLGVSLVAPIDRWRCNCCGDVVLSGEDRQTPGWVGLHTCTKQMPYLGPEFSRGGSCCMCKFRVGPGKGHYCAHRMWRWRMVDWTALPDRSLHTLQQQHGEQHLKALWQALDKRVCQGSLDSQLLGCVTCVLPAVFELDTQRKAPQDDGPIYKPKPGSSKMQLVHLLILPNKQGRGLYAAEDLSKWQPICVYSGVRVPHEEVAQRKANDPHLMLFTAEVRLKETGETVRATWDPRNVGGVAWLANSAHGRSANMDMFWAVLRDTPTAPPVGLLVANRKIRAGEELRYNYSAFTDRPDEVQACTCEDPACTHQLVSLRSSQ
jgi:hypothetical protein